MIKRQKTMDRILVVLAVFLFLFTVAMVVIFLATGQEPATLITCVFGACGGECGAMAWIKTTKDKYLDKELEEDE